MGSVKLKIILNTFRLTLEWFIIFMPLDPKGHQVLISGLPNTNCNFLAFVIELVANNCGYFEVKVDFGFL